MVFNPSGDTQIRAGGMLICVGRAESMAELTAQARGAARRTEKTPGERISKRLRRPFG